ncbi:MAG: LysM peptidoglycan-binding domain-containing protein [Ruminiclostridium sp.]|nr:LysM peptidoglycan-binding domain-containing protein [Ruminiclostridium sp.]
MYMYVDKYIVQPGDTLIGIARSFNLLSYIQILRVNREIMNPNLIYSGQIINIPRLTPMSTYIVVPGDTLGDIVYDYNIEHMEIYGFQITFDEVLAYNPMIENPDLIFPGMIIYLPEFL